MKLSKRERKAYNKGLRDGYTRGFDKGRREGYVVGYVECELSGINQTEDNSEKKC